MVPRLSAFLSLLSFGAVFGFFYAWVCLTMWGLDQIDPRAAITAMQGMNASVRNGVFALSFFGTPVYALVVFVLALHSDVLTRENAAQIWADYSPRWQFFNQARTVISGLCLALAGWGLYRLGGRVERPAP